MISNDRVYVFSKYNSSRTKVLTFWLYSSWVISSTVLVNSVCPILSQFGLKFWFIWTESSSMKITWTCVFGYSFKKIFKKSEASVGSSSICLWLRNPFLSRNQIIPRIKPKRFYFYSEGKLPSHLTARVICGCVCKTSQFGKKALPARRDSEWLKTARIPSDRKMGILWDKAAADEGTIFMLEAWPC